MNQSRMWRIGALALGLAWATAGAAQDGTALSPRSLQGRIVSVDSQGGSLVVDTTDRAHARPENVATATADQTGPAHRHGRRAAAARRDAATSQQHTAMMGDVERATDTKLEVAPNATVVRDGLNVPLDQVRPGDDVRAIFLTDDLTRTHPWKLEVRSRHGREAPWGVDTGAGG